MAIEADDRKIHEGLNVVEHWNGANNFLFFARPGQITSNRRKDHKISMLRLHLVQPGDMAFNGPFAKPVSTAASKLVPFLFSVRYGAPFTTKDAP